MVRPISRAGVPEAKGNGQCLPLSCKDDEPHRLNKQTHDNDGETMWYIFPTKAGDRQPRWLIYKKVPQTNGLRNLYIH